MISFGGEDGFKVKKNRIQPTIRRKAKKKYGVFSAATSV
jgi:hypothetical protein